MLISVSPMGVIILTLDEQISMANKAALEFLDEGTEEDILNKTMDELTGSLAEELDRMPKDTTVTIRLSDSRIYRCSRLSFVDHGFAHPFYLIESLTSEVMKAEKKAYDHASITGTSGGEYNVNKSTGDLVQTSGMPSEYPATQVMMSDGVTSVEDALDGLTANTFGTAVDISGYLENNKYTFPSDGYVELKATSSGAYVVVDISGMISIARSAYSDYVIIYVRKGMKFYKTTSYTGTHYCTFYPLQ